MFRVIDPSTRYLQFTLGLALAIWASMPLTHAKAASQRADYNTPASREETTGFVSGALLGGLAGGPAGIIVGGAVGALIGDGWHGKRQAGELETKLYSSQLQLAMLRERNEILQQEYQLVLRQLDGVRPPSASYQQASLHQSTNPSCCDNTMLSLHFRSGSTAIEALYEDQLKGLIALAQQLPVARIEIIGYADRQGNAESNLTLSRLRSEAVKTFLHNHGIQDAAITTVAYGDTRPVQTEQGLETDFFDRRVVVRLRQTSQQMLTLTPDGK